MTPNAHLTLFPSPVGFPLSGLSPPVGSWVQGLRKWWSWQGAKSSASAFLCSLTPTLFLLSPAAQGDGCLPPRAESCAASYKLWVMSLLPPSSLPAPVGRQIYRGFPQGHTRIPVPSGFRLQEKRLLLRAIAFKARQEPESGRLACATTQQRLSRGLRPKLWTPCPALSSRHTWLLAYI